MAGAHSKNALRLTQHGRRIGLHEAVKKRRQRRRLRGEVRTNPDVSGPDFAGRHADRCARHVILDFQQAVRKADTEFPVDPADALDRHGGVRHLSAVDHALHFDVGSGFELKVALLGSLE